MNRIVRFFKSELSANNRVEFMNSLDRFIGDIHNHCGISYGYGTLKHAIEFAKTQLDFFSVTGHFAWPDIETEGMCIPPDVIDYHKKGFSKLVKNWDEYKTLMSKCANDNFIPFASYEFHSFKYGDYTIVCKDVDVDLPSPVKEGQKDNRLEKLLSSDTYQRKNLICIPHHIGYKTGFRGINFDLFNPKVSPLIEIISMHGCAESDEALKNYLHTMGPRCSDNTYQGGLCKNLFFGVTGSTDHHNAAPGSYGYGRTLVWAKQLSRDSIWQGLNDRQTSAVSGDPIDVALFVNDAFQGSKAKYSDKLNIEAYVCGYDKLDKVEIVQGDKVIFGKYYFENDNLQHGMLSIMFGWGKKHKEAIWDIDISIQNGNLIDCSTRFRGVDMVDPLDIPKDSDLYIPSFSQSNDNIKMHFITDGNATSVTDSTMGCAIEIDGNEDTIIKIKMVTQWDGLTFEKEEAIQLSDLMSHSYSGYINGFVSPSFSVGKLRTISEVKCMIKEIICSNSKLPIYLRAYQKNGDCIFTSPVGFLE